MKLHASEQRDLETALRNLRAEQRDIPRWVAWFRPFIRLEPGAAVLDLGAAQGVQATAFATEGFTVYGVEPWEPAIEVSRQLAERTGIPVEIRKGVAEAIPFEDECFDLVFAYSVLEHVDDPRAVFREAHRVLRPGGGFFFLTTSALKPRQHEIRRFPLFPWYPPPVQRAIMRWAAEQRPSLVGHTTRPALHWFKYRKTREDLLAAGFSSIIDKWEYRAAASDLTPAQLAVSRAAARNRAVRLVGNLLYGNVEYLAIK